MTKPTPGPWIAASRPSSVVGLPIVSSPQGRSIASVTFFALGEAFELHDLESQANARLIAAAPDLLRAAEALLDHLTFNAAPSQGIVDMFREALAKARGETLPA
jgi:hypothetical protein